MRRIMLAIATISAVMFVNSARGSDDNIRFGAKSFYDPSTDSQVQVSGTLKGEDIPTETNNSYLIWCLKDQKNCLIAWVEDSGKHYVGNIEAYYIPITEWHRDTVTAADPGFGCWKTTITINRKTKEVLWIEEPINRSKDFCQKERGNSVKKWAIE